MYMYVHIPLYLVNVCYVCMDLSGLEPNDRLTELPAGWVSGAFTTGDWSVSICVVGTAVGYDSVDVAVAAKMLQLFILFWCFDWPFFNFQLHTSIYTSALINHIRTHICMCRFLEGVTYFRVCVFMICFVRLFTFVRSNSYAFRQ